MNEQAETRHWATMYAQAMPCRDQNDHVVIQTSKRKSQISKTFEFYETEREREKYRKRKKGRAKAFGVRLREGKREREREREREKKKIEKDRQGKTGKDRQ